MYIYKDTRYRKYTLAAETANHQTAKLISAAARRTQTKPIQERTKAAGGDKLSVQSTRVVECKKSTK